MKRTVQAALQDLGSGLRHWEAAIVLVESQTHGTLCRHSDIGSCGQSTSPGRLQVHGGSLAVGTVVSRHPFFVWGIGKV